MMKRWLSSSKDSRRRLRVARDSQARPKPRGSAHASNAVSLVILLLIVPTMIVIRTKGTRGRRRSITRRPRARHISERSGIRIAPPPTPTMKDSPPPPSTSHPSSPTSVTLASWQGEKKVSTHDTSTYASSSEDESSDDDEIDYSCLFKGLDRSKINKINELIDALNDK